MRIKKVLMAFVIGILLTSGAQAMGPTGFVLPARFYDSDGGRFISPDTVVPSAMDPQSLNRYSYVRNNPLTLVDPTGHSWLSSSLSKAGHWISRHREFTGLVWQSLDIFSGSAYLSSFENGRTILAGQVIAAGSFGAGGTAAGWGAVSGEISSAYVARKTGGNMMESVVRGGIEGAAISATFAGISNTNASWVEKAMVKSIISADLTAVQGGDTQNVEMAAALTFGAEAANAYFTKTVGYAPDPTPGVTLDTPDHTYPISKENYRPPRRTDVFGSNDGRGGMLHQGSLAMRSASSVPGMQAVSQIHDTWMNSQHISGSYLLGNQTIANIVTMPAAFVTSYAAQLSGPFAPAIIFSQE